MQKTFWLNQLIKKISPVLRLFRTTYHTHTHPTPINTHGRARAHAIFNLFCPRVCLSEMLLYWMKTDIHVSISLELLECTLEISSCHVLVSFKLRYHLYFNLFNIHVFVFLLPFFNSGGGGTNFEFSCD